MLQRKVWLRAAHNVALYARSKVVAEEAVLDAMDDILQANIIRMGNLTNRLADGVFQKVYESNAFP